VLVSVLRTENWHFVPMSKAGWPKDFDLSASSAQLSHPKDMERVSAKYSSLIGSLVILPQILYQ